jgi:hypothetical protein
MPGALKRKPNGAVVCGSRGNAVRRKNEDDTSCCTCGADTPTDVYPLLNCPDGVTENGQAVALTLEQAATYVGKVIKYVDVDKFICAIIGPLPDPPVDPDDYTFPTYSGTFDDCDTCCGCDGVTQPTAVTVSAPDNPEGAIVQTITGGSPSFRGCAGGYNSGGGDAPVVLSPGLYATCQIIFGLEADVTPPEWYCFWTMIVTVFDDDANSHEIHLYKAGGTTALGTYHTLTPSGYFDTATVS